MKKLIRWIPILLLLVCLDAPADTLARLDSMLTRYRESDGTARADIGRQLLAFYAEEAVFFGEPVRAERGESRQQMDLKVWFGAERYYTTVAYYAEALQYNELATALAGPADADIRATLLCDRSYCYFKRSDYQRAIEAGQAAKQLSRATDNLMQLSRAYLYLSLVNHALRNYDEAKRLVVKSIETNAELGVNVQTHNALGVACEIFCSARELDQAVDYGRQAVEAARAIDYEPGVANHLTQLSYAYNRRGDYRRGLSVADSAIAIVEAHEPLDRNQLAITLEFKSWNLLDMGRHREAADVMRRAIALEEQVGNIHAACYDYRTLCEALEPIDAPAALQALRRYIALSDSMHTLQLKELMSKADAEVRNDELQEEVDEGRRRTWTFAIIATVVVVLLLVAVVSLLAAFHYKNRSARALRRLTEARETFFTNVTHELRTPLTVILGLGRDLQQRADGLPTGELADWLRQTGAMIDRQGNQLLLLMNQLLDLSKLQSALAPQPVVRGNVAAYVGMVVEMHQDVAQRKGIALRYTCDDADGMEMAYVADTIRKVVGNLLSNAIKFTPRGGSVDAVVARKGGRLLLTVSDTGPGIPPADLPHIFEPFFRSAAGSDHEGTGIGLTLVKQLVDSQHGTISVDSSDRGTTFAVSLPEPAYSEHSEVPKSSESPKLSEKSVLSESSASSETPSAGQSPLVLIVEDNADVARLISRQLSAGYSTLHAANGREGILMARQQMPDLVITDLMMPDVDGLQLCATLRADSLTSHIPIVVLTAKVSTTDRITGIKAGADAYLTKPFDADELTATIERLLSQQATLRQKYSTPAIPSESTAPEQHDGALSTTAAGDQPLSATADGDTLLPSAQGSAEFVKKLDETIVMLMEQGRCDVENLASELCMSASQLRRKMNATIGTSPKRYMMNIRLSQAYAMLREHPERTVADVAERCGFYDHSHFVRAFREAYGRLPSEVDASR